MSFHFVGTEITFELSFFRIVILFSSNHLFLFTILIVQIVILFSKFFYRNGYFLFKQLLNFCTLNLILLC